MLTRLQTLAIMIIIGTFTLVQLLYIPNEYKWGLESAYTILKSILKK